MERITEKTINPPLRDFLKEIADEASNSRIEELLLALEIERNSKKLALRDARRGWVELPKDSMGNTLRCGDMVRRSVIFGDGGHSDIRRIGKISYMSICADSKWMLFVESGQEFENNDLIAWSWLPSNCILLKAPYDKAGREIKVGDWLRKEDEDHAVKITSIRHEKNRVVLSFDVGWYVWDKVGAPFFEVVPEPDSAENVLKDIRKEVVHGELTCDEGWTQETGWVPLNEAEKAIHRALTLGGGE